MYNQILTTDGLISKLKGFKFNRPINHIQVHHTWVPSHKTFYATLERNNNNYEKTYRDINDSMRDYHMNNREFSDIAQHITLFPDGKFIYGRDWNKIGAGIKGHNTGGIVLEMIGNFDNKGEGDYNPYGYDILGGKQLESLTELIINFMPIFKLELNNDTLVKHADFSDKTCWGTSFDKAWLINKIEEYKVYKEYIENIALKKADLMDEKMINENIENMRAELVRSGYKFDLDCSDVKIAQMELTCTEDWADVYDDRPIRMSLYKDSYYYKGIENIPVERHSYNTGDVSKILCPNAKSYLLPSISAGFKWASDNDIDIISVSLSGTYAIDTDELKFEDKIFNLISSGNFGVDKMSKTAKKKHWTSIGAVHLINGNITVPHYSSTGEELDFTSFSHLKLSDGKYHIGTSFSAPLAKVLLTQFYQLHYNYFGYKPTPKKANEFLMRNAIDLREEGHDNYTGHGLIYLPNEFDNFAYGEMADWDNYVIKVYPKGIKYYVDNGRINLDILKSQISLYMKNNNIKQVRL